METSRRGTTLGTTTKGLANEEDTGVWLASVAVADADDEGAHATVSLDDQAGHDKGDPVHIESRGRGWHESGREMYAINENLDVEIILPELANDEITPSMTMTTTTSGAPLNLDHGRPQLFKTRRMYICCRKQ